MKLLLKRLWEMKFCFFALYLFIVADDNVDKIIMAIFITFFGLDFTLKDLFEKYFGKEK
tara:strand:+ start:3728 stop:3904 length:177 start_codon:yes stop_codon:yes gene_type:complete